MSSVATNKTPERRPTSDDVAYPYIPQRVNLPSLSDPYNRQVASLLKSMGIILNQIATSTTTLFPITIDHTVYTADDLSRMWRTCSNAMSSADYVYYVNKFATESTKKGSVMIHIDLIGENEEELLDELQYLTVHQEIVISTFTTDGKVLIFLVLPSNRTINTYCSSPVQYNEVREIVSKLLGILRVIFSREFSLKRWLSVQDRFHEDTRCTALFLMYFLHRHGRYLIVSEHHCLNFKMSPVRNLTKLHDHHLGKLHIQDLLTESHPFYTKEFQDEDKFELIEQKGWHVMDVKGDGNCGYYAVLLALQNVGIDDFDIDTTSDPPDLRTQRWHKQVVDLRDHLRDNSERILRDVYRSGTPSRSLIWWGNIIGAPFEDDQNELSSTFVNPDFDDDLSQYFAPDFGENTEYHMNPYWSAFVIAFTFQVRVVLITRTTSPSETPKKDPKYHYATNIYNFEDNFEDTIDTFEPVVQHSDDAIRISDIEFTDKKTIELLFVTGYTNKDGTSDNNHFLFLRRVYSDGVPINIPTSTTCLVEFLETQNMNAVGRLAENPEHRTDLTSPMENPATSRTTPANVLPIARNSTEIERADIDVQGGRKRPSEGKQPEKQVVKPKKKAKVAASQPQQVRDPMPDNRTEADTRNEVENESHFHNPDDYDYMFDKKSGYFYRGLFNAKRRRYLVKQRIPDISLVDKDVIEATRNEPNTWISPGLGDPWDSEPPKALTTKVKVLYQQLNRPFCLTYCLASALYYCGFRKEASILAAQAKDIADLNMTAQLRCIRGFMPNLVPTIGGPTFFNHRLCGNNRNKRDITWHELFNEITRYPTLVVAEVKGRMKHAICVVDDLIFDASTTHALKLTMETITWIFQDEDVGIFVAYRFKTKVSPAGQKIVGTYDDYKESVVYHWNHEARRRAQARKILPNKAYDVEVV